MKTKIGINGFGRIGGLPVRAKKQPKKYKKERRNKRYSIDIHVSFDKELIIFAGSIASIISLIVYIILM